MATKNIGWKATAAFNFYMKLGVLIQKCGIVSWNFFMQGNRIASLHSLANIEQWAVDLSWDIIARFAGTALGDGSQLPREFFTDFVKVAGDEAKVLFKLNDNTRTNSLILYFLFGIKDSNSKEVLKKYQTFANIPSQH